jgi:hypothetical protein
MAGNARQETRKPDRVGAGREAAAGDSIDVTARTYHTENGVAHAEGETYAVSNRALAETLRGIGFVSIEGWTDGAIVAPEITALTPATVAIGAPDFTVHVRGTGFTPDSVIVWNGYDEPTTVVDDTELTTGVNMAVWQAAATVPVQVRAGGNLSNPVPFTFTETAREGSRGPAYGQTPGGRPPARSEIIHDDRRS